MSVQCGICAATIPAGELCQADRERQRRWLIDVPTLLDELLARSRRLTRGSGGGRGGNGRPLLWDETAARVHDDVAARVRLACGATDRQSAQEAAVAALAAWRTWGGVDAWLGLREAVQRAEDYLAPPARWYAGICSAAGVDAYGDPTTCTRDLYARGTTGTVRCPSCRAEHDVAARRAVLIDLVDEQQVSVREFVEAAPSLLGTDVRLQRAEQWVRRGRVQPGGRRTRTIRDSRTGGEYVREVITYRFGDLRDLAVARHAGRPADSGVDKSAG